MNNFRGLRPHELARQDQHLAEARNLGKTDPTANVVTTSYATEGEQCSWCDCTGADLLAHGTSDYECGGCQRRAIYVVVVLHGRPDERRYPVCYEHLDDDFAWWVKRLVGGAPPTVPTVRGILDRD